MPASLHFEQPNPNIPFGELNLEVVAQARPLRPGPAGVLADQFVRLRRHQCARGAGGAAGALGARKRTPRRRRCC